MTLIDFRGRPVDVDRLRGETAEARVCGVRSKWPETLALDLTPQTLAGILAAAAAGDSIEYLTLAEEMEEREAHYRGVLGTRKMAVGGLEVQIKAASDNADDKRIADEIYRLITSPPFDALVIDALDAFGKGYSVLEIMWDRSASQWWPAEFEWRDPRFFMFDPVTGRRLLLRDGMNAEGIELPPYKFVVHFPKLKTGLPIRGGLARIAATAFMCKSFTLKDWMAFVEIFGLPVRIGRYGPDATKEDIATLVSAVVNIGTDAAAVIPKSMEIEFLGSAGAKAGKYDRSAILFEHLAEWLDKQISKAVLGQTMTTDSGGSLAQAEVHNNVRMDILRSDAKKLAKTINRDVIKPVVDLNWGPRARYPMVGFIVTRPADLVQLKEALIPFIDLGLRVRTKDVREKFGLPEPDPGAAVLSPATTDGSRAEQQRGTRPASARKTSRAQRGTTAHTNELVRRHLVPAMAPICETAQQAASAEDLRRRLPELMSRLDGKAFKRALTAVLFGERSAGSVERVRREEAIDTDRGVVGPLWLCKMDERRHALPNSVPAPKKE